MIEFDTDKFLDLEQAIRDCVATAMDRKGLKLAYGTKHYTKEEIQAAALIALMVLTKTWVRPKGVKFIDVDKGIEL